jgi:hypothetical protein
MGPLAALAAPCPSPARALPLGEDALRITPGRWARRPILAILVRPLLRARSMTVESEFQTDAKAAPQAACPDRCLRRQPHGHIRSNKLHLPRDANDAREQHG